MTPLFFFDPDGYLLTGPKLMGRHAAGNGFLRAVIKATGVEETLTVGVLSQAAADSFAGYMAAEAPKVRREIVAARDLSRLAKAGLYFRPDVQLIGPARERLRLGPAAYALCGVTHTMASDRVLDILARTPFEPLMPWDAMICTSRAALSVANRVMDEAEDQHRWRTGAAGALPRLMLPLIPLGVHTEDYDFTEADRAAARDDLRLADGEVAFLSPGRISFNSKSHPFPLMVALQAAATRTGARLALVIAGQAEQAASLELYQRSAATLCPDVHTVFVDGADAARYRAAWAGADVFVSLSDNIQETFGLTPIEAMACGLPALVSDWDGYKDTVRDGIDGFRVATWAPAPGGGQRIAQDYENGAIEFGEYIAKASSAVAVDLTELAQRLDALIGDADLRRRMGEAGRDRARETFEWSVVYRQYQALWTEQDAMRRAALADPKRALWLAAAPRHSPAHQGPFDTFADFPTRHVDLATMVSLGAAATPQAYLALSGHESLVNLRVVPQVFDNFHRHLVAGPLSLGELATRSGIDPLLTIEAVTRLAKIGALTLDPPQA